MHFALSLLRLLSNDVPSDSEWQPDRREDQDIDGERAKDLADAREVVFRVSKGAA